ncbi:MAG: HAD-IA family hydrolase [Desulfobacteraceae bacterium]|nr:HAD-IA family hydrolase [Desulfobacteraceae bacterium]
MPLKPAGLLFDMDGVLVDSRESWYRTLADLIRERFGRALTMEAFLDRYWARDLRDIFAELGLAIDPDSFCRDVYSRFLDALTAGEGAAETLERLRLYPKAIITNTPAVCTRLILRQFRLERHFRAVLTGGEVENGKPHPEIVYKGCAALGIRPEEAVLIGDSPLDVRAGRAAGCPVVGLGTQGDYTIRRLPELLNLIEC